jgi:hypothetical protein
MVEGAFGDVEFGAGAGDAAAVGDQMVERDLFFFLSVAL